MTMAHLTASVLLAWRDDVRLSPYIWDRNGAGGPSSGARTFPPTPTPWGQLLAEPRLDIQPRLPRGCLGHVCIFSPDTSPAQTRRAHSPTWRQGPVAEAPLDLSEAHRGSGPQLRRSEGSPASRRTENPLQSTLCLCTDRCHLPSQQLHGTLRSLALFYRRGCGGLEG